MTKNEPVVYLGDVIELESERRFLSRLTSGLTRDATIVGNFFPPVRQTRQIDFLIRVPNRLQHIELKTLDPDLPLIAPSNGPWSQQLQDGTMRGLERNGFQQARSAKYAISDSLRDFSSEHFGTRPPVPAYNWIDTVVCIYPDIPVGSSIDEFPYVDVVGYPDLLDRLQQRGPDLPWEEGDWTEFLLYLKVFRHGSESPGAKQLRESADAVSDYQRRFVAVHSDALAPLVETPMLTENETVSQSQVVQRLTSLSPVLLLGESGTGKSFRARHAALTLIEQGHLPVWIRCGEFPTGSNFDALISRATAPYSVLTPTSLLSHVESTGSHLVLILDGLNETDPRAQTIIMERVAAMRLRHEIGVLITSTLEPNGKGLLSPTVVDMGFPNADQRDTLLVQYGAAQPERMAAWFSTPFELSIAAECEADLGPNTTEAELLDTYVRRVTPQETVHAGLRKLAAQMHSNLSTSLTVREAVGALETPDQLFPLSAEQVEATLESPLLDVSQGRVRFRHEKFLQLLFAEHLLLSHSRPEDLSQALIEGRNADVRSLVLGLDDNADRSIEVLRSLGRSTLWLDALIGGFGEELRDHAVGALSALIAEVASWTSSANLRMVPGGIYGIEWDNAHPLSNHETAMLFAAGSSLPSGRFVEGVVALLDRTDALIREQVGDDADANQLSAAVQTTYGPISNSETVPTRSIMAGLQMARLRHLDRASAVPFQDLLPPQGVDGWGRLLLVAQLLRHSEVNDHVEVLSQLITSAWRPGVYLLRLEAIQTAELALWGMTSDSRAAIGELLMGLESDGNIFVDSFHAEVLASYGMIEPIRSVEDILSEIDEVIDRPDDPDAWDHAGRIISLQFENEIVGPYYETISGMPRDKRTILLSMAGRSPRSFWHSWAIKELVKDGDFDEPHVVAALADTAADVFTDGSMWQHSLEAHIIAVQARASLDRPLPQSRHSTHAVWKLIDELIMDTAGSRAVRPTDEIWDEIEEECKESFVDALFWTRGALAIAPELDDPLKALKEAHPSRMKNIFEWSLANRMRLESVFQWSREDDRTEFNIRILGELGDEETLVSLKGYLVDAQFGEPAAEAIRLIRGRIH